MLELPAGIFLYSLISLLSSMFLGKLTLLPTSSPAYQREILGWGGGAGGDGHVYIEPHITYTDYFTNAYGRSITVA